MTYVHKTPPGKHKTPNNVDLMLGQRQRRWTNIRSTLLDVLCLPRRALHALCVLYRDLRTVDVYRCTSVCYCYHHIYFSITICRVLVTPTWRRIKATPARGRLFVSVRFHPPQAPPPPPRVAAPIPCIRPRIQYTQYSTYCILVLSYLILSYLVTLISTKPLPRFNCVPNTGYNH